MFTAFPWEPVGFMDWPAAFWKSESEASRPPIRVLAPESMITEGRKVYPFAT